MRTKEQIEEKDLLLKDLCARLPYEPIVEYVVKGIGGNATITCTLDTLHLEDLLQDSEDLVHIKPYLRPMSSMTEEETVEYCDLQDKFLLSSQYPVTDGYALFDWLNKKMFDYRGLIPAGAAIAINEKNNPYKD